MVPTVKVRPATTFGPKNWLLLFISDVGSVQNYKILGDSDIRKIASGVILSPKGTILHGNLSSNIEKRPKIKIYYTEPED